jgi:DNA-binding response OmpR family regulator
MPHYENPKDKIILVVDDDEYVCEFLKALMEKEGFKVCTVSNGESALKIVQSEKIDLIILDWMMPVLSGFEVLKLLQKEEHKDIPVMVITARVTDEGTVTMIKREINVVDFLSKSVSPSALIQRVHEILKTRRMNKAAGPD